MDNFTIHRRQSGLSMWTLLGSLLVIAGLAGLGFSLIPSIDHLSSAPPVPEIVAPQNKSVGNEASPKMAPMPATVPTPPPTINVENNEATIPVKASVLPEGIDAFIRSRGFRVPNSIDKNCGFDFSTDASPFFIRGDFDGDGQTDFAINVEKMDHTRRILVFFSRGTYQELDGMDYIHLVARRGPTETFDGPTANLRNDAIGWVACEKSSGFYAYNKGKNAFERFFTSD